jgi:hypothetical protein
LRGSIVPTATKYGRFGREITGSGGGKSVPKWETIPFGISPHYAK